MFGGKFGDSQGTGYGRHRIYLRAMSEQPKRTLVTSALPYANGPIHIGHIAGAYLPADLYVRYLRARGRDVVWGMSAVSPETQRGVAVHHAEPASRLSRTPLRPRRRTGLTGPRPAPGQHLPGRQRRRQLHGRTGRM